MSHIGIDSRMISHTGIGTYLRGFLSAMPEVPEDFTFTLFGSSIPAESPLPGFEQKTFNAKIYSLKEQWEYGKFLKDCDLWHSPHYNAPLRKGRVRLVVTVHDLIHWIFRKDYFSPLQALYAQTMFHNVVRTADHIIAVSKTTANDLVKYFNAKPHHISVIYEGIHRDFVPAKGTLEHQVLREKYRLPNDFFLYVGSLKPHKNVHTLLKVYRSLRKQGKLRSGLVIIGKKDRKYSHSLRSLASLQSDDQVIYLPGIGNGELPAFYQMASALVHPSLYEGFGLTPLESMACGTPVIASRGGSIPEVSGDAALLFDPRSEEELSHAMIRLETEPALAAKLRDEGFRNIKLFRWEDTAKRTLEVYRRVLG